nr:ParB N-terminal domain-containing protein [Rhodobacter sp. NTK016B]
MLIEEIALTERLRPVAEDRVAALIELIDAYGFTTPIVVRKTRTAFTLIDGAHRIEAMRRLGHNSIPVVACSCTDDEAALMEAGQNLPGGMNALDDAVFMVAWRRAYLRLHPETAGGVAGALAKHGVQVEKIPFAEIAAQRRGVTKAAIYKTIAAVESLQPSEIDILREAPRVAVSDLREIGKISAPDERAQVVQKLANGEAKNAATARRQYRAERGDAAPVVKDAVDQQYLALMKAWKRSGAAARRRFLDEIRGESLGPEVAAE